MFEGRKVVEMFVCRVAAFLTNGQVAKAVPQLEGALADRGQSLWSAALRGARLRPRSYIQVHRNSRHDAFTSHKDVIGHCAFSRDYILA